MPRFQDAVYSKQFDYGGMFKGECGVRKINDKFYAYASDGWGGGRQGPGKLTLEEAKEDIKRLKRLI